MNKDNELRVLAAAVSAGIQDRRELANFMAQVQVESGGFRRLTEGLNYSPKRLLEVFRTRNGLDSTRAVALSKQGPEAIAEAMYGGEWGFKNLGNTSPGDGWRYRGRGFIQLSGKKMYAEASRYTGIDLLAHPELAANPDVAATIAVSYWKSEVRRVGAQLDSRAATKVVNGGQNGAADRRVAMAQWVGRFEREQPEQILAAAGISARGSPAMAGEGPRQSNRLRENPRLDPGAVGLGHPDASSLRIDDSGVAVLELQGRLDQLGYRDGQGTRLHLDGNFGHRTAAAVVAFQQAHGLAPDGVVGPRTQAALDAAALSGPTPVDPAHPDHALHRQLARAVGGMDLALGRAPDAASAQLAAALLVGVRAAGLTRVDHVVLSAGTPSRAAGLNVFAVQGALEDPASRRVRMSTTEALAAPVDHWQARLAALAPSQQERGARAAEERLEHHEGMRRIPQP